MIAVLLLSVSALSASDWSFLFTNADNHTGIIAGFCPTYIQGGVSYDGFELIEDRKTRLQLVIGGGYTQRKLWQDPETGVPAESIRVQPLIYDVGSFDWALKFKQGFWKSMWDPEADLLTLTVAYEGRFEANLDSMNKGMDKANWGDPMPVLGIDEFLGNKDSDIYPDLKGDHMFLGNSFNIGLELDLMQDTVIRNDGIKVNLDLDWAPLALNSALGGEADFMSLVFSAVGAKTLYSYSEGDMNWFGLQLVDRVYINWTTGDQVPAYAQKPGSLGRQIRGYASWSFNRELSIVNNFDIRLIGPMMGTDLLYPRLILFFDMGYAMGRYYNTDYSPEGNFLSSVGAQICISFIDAVDLGCQVAYLIGGEYNYSDGPTPFTWTFFFFLDF